MGDIAVNAPTVQEEEAAWTKMLDRFAGLPDIEVRVRCNRGNSLARQGKLDEALKDYDRAIELVPNAADPHLNRGAVYESLGRLEEALKDYDVELKEDDDAVKTLRKLLARYAEAFPDARAAYALILWDQGTVQGNRCLKVQELRRDTIKRKSNGGMDLATFRQMMLRVFAIDDINDFVLQDAYDQCNAAAGPIDSRKFMTWPPGSQMGEWTPSTQSEDVSQLFGRHQVSCIDMDKVKAKFDHFDVDKSGVIDFQEFEAMMHELLHCHSKTDLPRNRLNRFWHEADLDGNGVIDFEEFTERALVALHHRKYRGEQTPVMFLAA
eukprot:Skav214100  [mRNA]  locus=scaffold1185:192958:203195:- [translate_table: standard]